MFNFNDPKSMLSLLNFFHLKCSPTECLISLLSREKLTLGVVSLCTTDPSFKLEFKFFLVNNVTYVSSTSGTFYVQRNKKNGISQQIVYNV
jgi:hypothetical protein